ncbi:hypothetical protein BIV57_06865 [Mangrovactinospora gilvigrisea]|uniref:Uncharacterized protein n=1 Tax=Mangrovactinospora gilvigrisea TaxID=1428644 RepID=A0A1J7CEX7_9ACTN|nr:hypothetical protein [Mangrovactinospora gilvigrisea]OIV38250.1 hypothetical protein BIV57_06865 [Mangrovactinospora gilvigrisea]
MSEIPGDAGTCTRCGGRLPDAGGLFIGPGPLPAGARACACTPEERASAGAAGAASQDAATTSELPVPRLPAVPQRANKSGIPDFPRLREDPPEGPLDSDLDLFRDGPATPIRPVPALPDPSAATVTGTGTGHLVGAADELGLQAKGAHRRSRSGRKGPVALGATAAVALGAGLTALFGLGGGPSGQQRASAQQPAASAPDLPTDTSPTSEGAGSPSHTAGHGKSTSPHQYAPQAAAYDSRHTATRPTPSATPSRTATGKAAAPATKNTTATTRASGTVSSTPAPSSSTGSTASPSPSGSSSGTTQEHSDPVSTWFDNLLGIKN